MGTADLSGQGAGAQRAGEQGAGGHCGNPSIARGTLLFVAFCCFLIIYCCFWLLLAAFSCFFGYLFWSLADLFAPVNQIGPDNRTDLVHYRTNLVHYLPAPGRHLSSTSPTESYIDAANLPPICRQSGASGRPILRKMRNIRQIQFGAYY